MLAAKVEARAIEARHKTAVGSCRASSAARMESGVKNLIVVKGAIEVEGKFARAALVEGAVECCEPVIRCCFARLLECLAPMRRNCNNELAFLQGELAKSTLQLRDIALGCSFLHDGIIVRIAAANSISEE